MKRHALILIVSLSGILSLLGCVTVPEDTVDTVEVEEDEVDEDEVIYGLNCKAQCVQELRACLADAQSPQDRVECLAARDVCMDNCEDCGHPEACPLL